MKIDPGIFLAYDVRGKVGTALTGEVALSIGRALADFLPEKGTVAVGRDMRPDSAELATALIKGLTRQGRDVLDIGQVTSDMIYFAVGKFGLAGGAMVTASHNPGEYNGIKFCREAARPIGIETGLVDIRDAVVAGTYRQNKAAGRVETRDVSGEWIEHALSFIEPSNLKPLRIAIDTGNGMAGAIIPKLEKHLPLQVTPLYFELDGTFPNHIANPLEPKNLEDLIQAVRAQGLDGGLAFDGDGDRAVLVDETGRAVSGTEMTAMLAHYFLQQHPGSTILVNAICGLDATKTVEREGGIWHRSRVGHSYIKADMAKYGAVFAGEHSGHYYFRDNYNADSGLIAALVALQVLSDSGKKLSELIKDYRHYVQIPETNFEVEDKEAVIRQVAESFKDGKQDVMDGLTVRYGDEWFNLRPSNTEPLLRLNAEAKTREDLEKLVGKVRRAGGLA